MNQEPVLIHKPKPNITKKKNRKILLIISGSVLALILIGATAVAIHSLPSANFKASITGDSSTWAVISPSKISIPFSVKNIGNATGTPSCTIQAFNSNYSNTGVNNLTSNNALKPGQENYSADTLTITNQGAASITSASIDCGSGTTTNNSNVAAGSASNVITQLTNAQQVSSWYQQHGSSIVNSLTNDFGNIETDAKTDNLTTMESDCTQLFDDAITAQADPGIPDSTINNDWQNALSSFVSAGENCQTGTLNSDASQIEQAASEIDQGSTSLNEATQAIQKLE